MYDYLILGQGLAGSLLAWQLIHKGQRVLVLDDGHQSASSRVAAGLINPLAGMRFNAAPETDVWLATLHTTYRQIARELGTSAYLHEVSMQRLLRTPEQRRFLERQRNNPAARQYLGDDFRPGMADPGVRSPQGGFWQHATAYVDLPRLLRDLRTWLEARQAFELHEVKHDAIRADSSGVQLATHQARHLVCCEGFRMQSNPWFAHLPMQPDKGEILRLRAPRQLCQHIINGRHWLVPLANGSYRFGATHEHHEINCQPSTAGRTALEMGLQDLLVDTADIEVSEHLAGVRPATRDRQPLTGTHASAPRMHLFNGFGARGAISIPWYSERMCDYLLQQLPLPAKADIRRYHQ